MSWEEDYKQGYLDAVSDALALYEVTEDFETELKYLAMIVPETIINYLED